MSHLANKFGDLPVCRGQKNSLKSSQFEITIVKSRTMDVCVSLYVLDMALFWEIHLVLEIVTICDLFVYLGGHKLFTAEKRNKTSWSKTVTMKTKGKDVMKVDEFQDQGSPIKSSWYCTVGEEEYRQDEGQDVLQMTKRQVTESKMLRFSWEWPGWTQFIPNLLMSPPFLLTIKMQFTPWHCTSNLCKVCP